MSRKATITQKEIVNAAFKITKKEGFESITSRKLAAATGCSTQPIFRVYKNMSELQTAVYDKAVQFFRDYYAAFDRVGKVPFTNLGMAYIAFARKEKNLFRLLFVDAKPGRISMYELLNGSEGNVVAEINMAKEMGCSDPGSMFMKMWIFIHGAACMTLSGDYDLTDEETMSLLEKAYNSFLV